MPGSVITDGNRSSLKNLDENSNTANLVTLGRSNVGGQPGIVSSERRVCSISPVSMDSNHGSGVSHDLEHPHHLGHSSDRSAKSK